jgi:hypothetical protein
MDKQKREENKGEAERGIDVWTPHILARGEAPALPTCLPACSRAAAKQPNTKVLFFMYIIYVSS